MSDVLKMAEAELERRLQHSAAGAKHATLQGVVGRLRHQAGVLFSQKRDALASEVRDLAEEFEKDRLVAEEVLNEHIKRSIDESETRRRSSRK
jgi:hypothetical protein